MSELKGPAHARAVGSFLLNLLQAEAGTGILEWFFPTFYTPRTVAGFSLKEALVSAVISFTAGFLIFYFRRPRAARWVWLAGVCWMVARAVQIAAAGGASSIFADLSGSTCASGKRLDLCEDFLWVTIPLVRTAFYSAGAFLCARMSSAREAGLTAAPKLSDPAEIR